MTLAQRRARSDEWVRLHTVKLASTYEIAKQYGVKADTVKQALLYRGVLRPSLGKDIERKVFYWLIGRVSSCMRKRGDRAYDLLVNGERIDVKSSRESLERSARYVFALHHKQSRRVVSEADWYWFVLKDRVGSPIYSCATDDINVKSNVSIRFETFITDPRFHFIGYLDDVKILA